MARGRPREHRAVICRQRVIGGDHVGAEADEDVDEDDDRADGPERPRAAELQDCAAPAAAFRDLRNFAERRGLDGHH